MLSRFVLIFGVCFAGAAHAQAVRATKANQPIRLYTMWNCQTHIPPVGAAASATNGTVVKKETTQNRCNNPREPVVEFWFTPAPGFKGRAHVQILGGAAGSRGGQQYYVDVK